MGRVRFAHPTVLLIGIKWGKVLVWICKEVKAFNCFNLFAYASNYGNVNYNYARCVRKVQKVGPAPLDP